MISFLFLQNPVRVCCILRMHIVSLAWIISVHHAFFLSLFLVSRLNSEGETRSRKKYLETTSATLHWICLHLNLFSFFVLSVVSSLFLSLWGFFRGLIPCLTFSSFLVIISFCIRMISSCVDILFLSFLRLPSNDILFSHFLEISHLHLHVCLWSFFLLLPFILSVFLYHLPSLVSYFLLLHPSQILLSRVKWEKDGGGREDGSRSQKDWNVQGGWKQVSLFFNEKSSQEEYNKGMKEGK